MPSNKPLIAVRLRPHVFEVYSRLAALQGRSRGGVVAEILETVYEPLMRTVALLEAARDAPVEVRQGLKRTLEDMERELVGAAGSSLAQMDLLVDRLMEHPVGEGATPGATPRPGALSRQKIGERGGSTPVPVTRGSGRLFVQQSGRRKRTPGGS